MKNLGILVILVSVFLLFGCTSQSQSAGNVTTDSGKNNGANTNNSANGATNTTVNTNTNNYTTVITEGNTTIKTNINSVGSDWCVAGGNYDVSEAGSTAGTVTGSIKGYVTFKGGQYCQVDSTVNTGGYSISYTYYVSADKNDMWVTTNFGGQTQETHVTVPENGTTTVTTQNNTNTTVTAPTTPASYSAADCSILTVDDFKSICDEPNVVATIKTKVGKVCSVDFGVKTGDGPGGPIGRWMTVETSSGTESQVMSGINACSSFGITVGATGCRIGRGAIIAKGTYLVGFEAATTMTPEQWLCTEEQVTELIQLVQSR